MLLGLTLATLGLQCTYMGIIAQIFFLLLGRDDPALVRALPLHAPPWPWPGHLRDGPGADRVAARLLPHARPAPRRPTAHVNYLGVTGLFLTIAGFVTFTFALLPLTAVVSGGAEGR